MGSGCIYLAMRRRRFSTKLRGVTMRIGAQFGLVFLGCVVLTPPVTVFPARQPAAAEQNDTAIFGRLVARDGKTPTLHLENKDVPLVSEKRSIAETLRDSRLSGRELKAVGHVKADGSFEVREFFVVRPDALYRVIYHCDVCNITTFSPGDCMCCQAPTVPVEVLPTDPRIYHEEIQGPPKSKVPE